MIDVSARDYYSRREGTQRAMAAAARDPVIANIHIDMADHYARLVRSDESDMAHFPSYRSGSD